MYLVKPKKGTTMETLGKYRWPQSSSFLGFIFRILQGNPQKELLWGLSIEPEGASPVWVFARQGRSRSEADSFQGSFTGSCEGHHNWALEYHTLTLFS